VAPAFIGGSPLEGGEGEPVTAVGREGDGRERQRLAQNDDEPGAQSGTSILNCWTAA